MVDYLYLKDSLHTFRQNYNFLKIFSIGKSILNNEIYCIKFGIGKKEVLYTAGIHAPEWITSLLLIKFAQNLCNAFVSNSQIYGYDAKYLYENCSLYIIPMINLQIILQKIIQIFPFLLVGKLILMVWI